MVVPTIEIMFFLPVNTQEELEFRSEKSERLKAPFGYPDKFAEFFAQLKARVRDMHSVHGILG